MSGDADVPRARLRRGSLLGIAVWVVPLVAAIVAGVLVYQRMQEYGPSVTIRFKDGAGLRVGQTAIKYRGVQVGAVRSVDLSPDQQYVLVKAQLRRSAAALARDGATFWIVRPEVGLGNITGLGTVITGPEIEVLPGAEGGAPKPRRIAAQPVYRLLERRCRNQAQHHQQGGQDDGDRGGQANCPARF